MTELLADPRDHRGQRRHDAGGDAGRRDDRARRASCGPRSRCRSARSSSTGCCPSCSRTPTRRRSRRCANPTCSTLLRAARRPRHHRGARRGAARGVAAAHPGRAPRAAARDRRPAAALRAVPVRARRTACASRAWSPTRSARSSACDRRPGPRAAARDEGDRRVLRLGRRGQDVGRGGRRARRRDAGSAARCSCSRSTRPSGSRPRSASTGIGNRRAPGAARGAEGGRASSRAASCGPRCSTRSSRGTTSCCATRPTRRPRTASSRTGCTTTSPRASCRATTTSRWSGCTRSTPTGEYDLIVDRHAADAERDRLPRRARAHGRVLRRPAAALAHAAVPRRRQAREPRAQRREPALLPDGRPHPRQQVPRRTSPSSSSTSSRCTTASSTRANAVEQLLHDRRTTFAVVTTLEAAPLHEAERFCQELVAPQVPPRRARPQQDAARLPARSRRRERGHRARRRRRRRSREALVGARRTPRSPIRRAPRGCCARSASRTANFSVVAMREAELRGELARGARRRRARPELRGRHRRRRRVWPCIGSAPLRRGHRREHGPVPRRAPHRAGRHRPRADRTARRDVAAARRPLVLRPAAARADRARGGPPVRRARAGASGHRADELPAGPRRQRHRRGRAAAAHALLAHGRDRRGRHAARSARRTACTCSASRCCTPGVRSRC